MPRPLVFWTVAAVAVAAAVWQAWALAWTCDDAFISFRYAQHFVDGHGLVFNLDPSEAPVEGYTNFSWTMWLALGVALGFVDQGLENWSIFWGVVCHGATVLLLAVMAWRSSSGRALVPIAACAYAAIHHAASLAPAGLETALFVLLATVMLYRSIAIRCVREAWLLGFVGVLCAMTRPDGALFVAMAGLFVLYDALRRRAPRLLLGSCAPFVLVFAPYLLWRHGYYGLWVPNTAIAKSASDPFLSQGWSYVQGFLFCYYALLPAFGVLLWFVGRKGDALAPITPFLGRRAWLAVAAFTLPYVLFVMWVGGDFMFGRFLLPVLPALLFGWDLACQRWRPLWLQPAIAVALVLGLTMRVEPEGLDEFRNPVSDNRRISFLEVGGVPLVDIGRSCGALMQELFRGLDVRIAISGGHANLAYRSRVPVAVECAAGLTDAYIARVPPTAGRKRGHNRPWTLYPEYLEQRGVHFMLELSYRTEDAWRGIVFPCRPVPVPARIVIYDRELMAELKRREPSLQFVDFEAFLDDYLSELDGKSKEQVRGDYANFRGYYFDHNEDPERQGRFEELLR